MIFCRVDPIDINRMHSLLFSFLIQTGFIIQFQKSFTYYCTQNGTIVCLNGWREPKNVIGNSRNGSHGYLHES